MEKENGIMIANTLYVGTTMMRLSSEQNKGRIIIIMTSEKMRVLLKKIAMFEERNATNLTREQRQILLFL